MISDQGSELKDYARDQAQYYHKMEQAQAAIKTLLQNMDYKLDQILAKEDHMSKQLDIENRNLSLVNTQLTNAKVLLQKQQQTLDAQIAQIALLERPSGSNENSNHPIESKC